MATTWVYESKFDDEGDPVRILTSKSMGIRLKHRSFDEIFTFKKIHSSDGALVISDRVNNKELHKVRRVHASLLIAMKEMLKRVVKVSLTQKLQRWVAAIENVYGPPAVRIPTPNGFEYVDQRIDRAHIQRIVGPRNRLSYFENDELFYFSGSVSFHLNVAVDPKEIDKIAPAHADVILLMKEMKLMVPDTALGDKLDVWISDAEARYGPPPPRVPHGLLPYRASGFAHCPVHSKYHHGRHHIAGHPHLELDANCNCVDRVSRV